MRDHLMWLNMVQIDVSEIEKENLLKFYQLWFQMEHLSL